jgi:molybdopterin-binding protein
MKTSARNQFTGTVREIIRGPVSAEVTIEIVSGIRITAIISARSVDDLGLSTGKRAYALVKASNVIIAVD